MTIPNSQGLMPSESCLPLTPEEERETVEELTRVADASPKEGDVWCLISARWFRGWKRYVQLKSSNDDSITSEQLNGIPPHVACKPGKIDNSELVTNGTYEENNGLVLRRNLLEEEDYCLVPQEVWKKLHEWYKGGPELPRKRISLGLHGKSFAVEVYPLSLQLVDGRDLSERTITISRKALVGELYSMVCTLLTLEQAKVDIWDYYEKVKHDNLQKFDQTLEEAELMMDQDILLEVKDDAFFPSNSGVDSTGNELALVPIEPPRSPVTIAGGPTFSNGYSNTFGSHFLQGNSFSSVLRDMDDDNDSISNGSKGSSRGLRGLQNLGNTCFMNSALQCLVHTPDLVRFFLQDYTLEINKDNPLGMQGELATAFGDLLRNLWSSGATAIAPRSFKAKLARFAPQFSGYNQHDSQELLAFLLDGLHEDLNRVINKPYIEAKDANGRSDEEFADECWNNHKARNDSIIVDVCQGQYKSTLVCPVCSKVSVTFDPFMYLSLPLPSTTTRTMTVTVFSGVGSALPMPFTVTVPKNGTCRDLSRALNVACSLTSSEDLLLAEVYKNRIYRYLDFFDSLSGIKNEECLVAYKLPANYKDFVRLEIMHQRIERPQEPQYNLFSPSCLGTPLVTCLSKEAKTGADIHTAVCTLLSPLLRGKTPMKHTKVSKENGYLSSLDGVVPGDDSNPCTSDTEFSDSFMEIEMEDDACPSLQIAFTNERGYNRVPIDNDSNIPPGSCIRVLLEWSDKNLELYDFSFLEDLPEVFRPFGSMVKKTREEAITLFSCLDAFLKEEPLGPDDMWYCPGCKEHRQATKKLDLWRLPEILVVHLKRFSYSRYMKNKLDTFVNFPVHDLDLSQYVKHNSDAARQTHVYELYAVSNHYGGLGGGHYSAYAKLIEEDSWFHFDDSFVSPASEDSIQTTAAYVLFYRRVQVDTEKSNNTEMGNGEEPSSSANSLT
ncbi:ubiquitin carboxyl-terminal hydrolase 9-like [Asparagus officinalis]|uniref:ubiquitin carboxyl-terminal hydrolase 9-like n=1 Tax=Asparagus officinalis TaxID=4686 RepID=UPI00098DE98C|nr:ubiquitin carboxyl-terminal hydrolase 9-like [Asparagus officinalis]